jgi:hypothetical protein
VTWLRKPNLAIAVLAMLTPLAHLLELPNKFLLDAPLWLAVQQHLYRGWGPFLAGPAEVGALASALFLAHLRGGGGRVLLLTVIACVGYAGHAHGLFRPERAGQLRCLVMDIADSSLGLDELPHSLGNRARRHSSALRYVLGGPRVGLPDRGAVVAPVGAVLQALSSEIVDRVFLERDDRSHDVPKPRRRAPTRSRATDATTRITHRLGWADAEYGLGAVSFPLGVEPNQRRYHDSLNNVAPAHATTVQAGSQGSTREVDYLAGTISMTSEVMVRSDR